MESNSRHPRGLLVAGTHSGAGKTTVALGLLDLWKRRGLAVQPFKAGPDFIDPGLHSLLAGRVSRNLDSFLLAPDTLRFLFSRSARAADLAVVEGVAGLFDGYSGLDARGSTAEVARILGLPVILVCDAQSSARSIAAVVRGFQAFDPQVRIAGVFLNRLAGTRHLEWCRAAVERSCKVPVVGWFFQSPRLQMEERHLGLVPAGEKPIAPSWLREIRRQMDRQTREKTLLRISRAVRPWKENPPRRLKRTEPVRIGIARDKAFHFYYQDNLDLLSRLGVELVPFSPLEDSALPKNLQGLYLGGGFPEVYARELEDNAPLRAEILRKSQEGLLIYAECGGLMYLGRSLRDLQGKSRRMAGVLPYATAMSPRIKMAYCRARVRRDTLLSRKGDSFPGQVFHFSEIRAARPLSYAYRISNGGETFPDGIVRKNILASYLHLHFWSRPSLAENFVRTCAQWKGGRG